VLGLGIRGLARCWAILMYAVKAGCKDRGPGIHRSVLNIPASLHSLDAECGRSSTMGRVLPVALDPWQTH
jgi:hypothetical protein